MAKKAYVGVNGISKNVKNIYVGVNGVPKKVVKGYVGVNGVPKLFFDGGSTPVVVPSWDYWASISKNLFDFYYEPDREHYSYVVNKTNSKIAYYAIIKTTNSAASSSRYYATILLSPNRDAVVHTIRGVDSYVYYSPTPQSVYDSNGILWYYTAIINTFTTVFNMPSELIFNDKVYVTTSVSETSEAARDLIDAIYSVPFHENYQVGTEYRIPACGDVEKTIRKLVGWQLAKCVSEYTNTSAHYKEYSDNIDTIINSIMSYIQSHNNQNGVVILDVLDSVGYWSDGLFIYVAHGHYDSEFGNKINYLDKVTPTQKITSGNNGFPCYLIEFKFDYGSGEETSTHYQDWGFMERETFLYMNNDGTYTITDDIAGYSGQWGTSAFIGLHENAISNLGIDL